MSPAVGKSGGPGSWKRAVKDGAVALHARDWADAKWSSIFARDSAYAADSADPEAIAAANLRGRGTEGEIQGPMMKPAVWTWEVPTYFWFGGMAAGASFVAFACDLSGDHDSAVLARRVALGALMPCPPLLVADLGRPERFHHMLRIFKPRSPMSMGSWCLSLFGGIAFSAVVSDLLERPRLARFLGALSVPVGAYLGSYTGVLLASTAVPVWKQSARFLGPIFVSTATLTGAGAVRLTVSSHQTKTALARVEDAAVTAELVLSAINRRRLGSLAVEGPWFSRAQWLVRGGLAARLCRLNPLASVCFMGAALCYRFGWVRAGHASATDDAAVASTARLHITQH
ncbi:MAG: polysulfide reductase NrfD [Solirubrobacterales bacterium]|nr:polysulfide reductase NrfD [Solirubrobacterales bacterium]